MLKIIRLNDPFRGYIRPTDKKTNQQIAICAKRIIGIYPTKENPNHTLIDCGQCVGFEAYKVKEPLETIKTMIQNALQH